MQIHGGGYGDDVLDFSVNTNPNVTITHMAKLLSDSAMAALKYPEIDGTSTEAFIGKAFGIEPGRLAIGNGAIDCLYRVVQVMAPSSAVIIEPTFSEYKQALNLYGCDVHALVYDVSESARSQEELFLTQLRKIKAELVVICNPNNPTGHVFNETFIERLIEQQAKHKGYVLVDESFRFFEDIKSCYRKEAWNLVVLTSLTKYYGIPGLRIGYMTANHGIIEGMKEQQIPWNINGLAESVIRSLMTDASLVKTTKEWYEQAKTFMTEGLGSIDYLEPLESRTNYILCHMKSGSSKGLNKYLMSAPDAISVRECDSFAGLSGQYIRIGLKDHDSNKRLVEKLKNYKGDHHE